MRIIPISSSNGTHYYITFLDAYYKYVLCLVIFVAQ